jgi:hypothetical protein
VHPRFLIGFQENPTRVLRRTFNLVTGFSVESHITIGKGKGKAIPLQALTGPEGSRRLRLPDFKTIGT